MREKRDARAVTLDETRSYCQRSVNFARAALHETRARRKTSRRFNPRRRKHACPPPPPPSLFRSPVLAFLASSSRPGWDCLPLSCLDTRVDYARARARFFFFTRIIRSSLSVPARASPLLLLLFFLPSFLAILSLSLLYIDRRLFRRRLRPRKRVRTQAAPLLSKLKTPVGFG